MVDRQRNYYVANNAGSIHNRDTAPLLVGHSNKKSAFKLFQIVKVNWQIFFYALVIVMTLCGEAIFRKSVATIMYNYRWFILILLNVLSFLLYLCIILYRKITKYIVAYKKKKRKKEKKQRFINNKDKDLRNNDNSDIISNISVTTMDSDLISNISSYSYSNASISISETKAMSKSSKSKKGHLHWRSYLIISTLDCIHMIFIFIPSGVLPANIVMCVPLIGISIFSLFNCCISCDNQYIALGVENIFGCVLLFVSIFLLIFQDKSMSFYLTDNALNYDKKYISNLILFFVGCVVLIFNDIYKRICLSKIKVDMIEFNLIQSTLSILILWLLSPLAFHIQYISKYSNEYGHVTNIAHSLSNIGDGAKCLFGSNTYDTVIKDKCCDIAFAYPIFQVMTLIFFIITNRLSQNQLLQNQTYLKYVKNKNSFIQHLLSISIVFTFLLCYSKEIQQLWNGKNNGMVEIHLKMDWETALIAVLLCVGALLSFRKIDQRKVSIKLLEEQWIIS